MSNFENNFNEQKNIILQIDNLKKTFKDNISGESLTIIDGLSMQEETTAEITPNNVI